jgi:hypothetical protein
MSADAAAVRSPVSWSSLAGLVGALILAGGLLAIGMRDDFRLKHEDNNALYTTFARAHLVKGLAVTGGQDAFVDKSGQVSFYGHHPGGPALLLAAAMKITGIDAPVMPRAVAASCHLLGLVFFVLLLRPVARPAELVLGAALYAILPQGAFFCRMLNHEPLVLPAVLLLVERYFHFLRTGRVRALAGMALAAVWGAAMGWAAFFVMAACLAHAGLAMRAGRVRAARAGVWLTVTMLLCLGLDIAQLIWVHGGGTAELDRTLLTQLGVGGSWSPSHWVLHQVDIHRRYFSLAGFAASVFAAWRLGQAAWEIVRRGARAKPDLDPLVERAGVFIAAGSAYALVFNTRAELHHYWQFLFLPAVVSSLLAMARAAHLRIEDGCRGRRLVAGALLFEILATSALTLRQRHTRPEAYCIRTVANLRSRFL